MTQADINEQAAITMLAQIVNRAARKKGEGPKATCEVPFALLLQAKSVLERFNGTEFCTTEVKHALTRLFD